MARTVDTTILAHEPISFDTRSRIPAWPANIWKFCRRKPLGAFGGFIVVAMLFIAIFVDYGVFTNGTIFGCGKPLLAPDGCNHQHIRNVSQGVSLAHLMGTDELGRDVLSRVLYGARVSVVIGYTAVAIAAISALLIGTASGYFGGWFDMVVQRVVDVFQAIPPIVLLLFALTVFASRATLDRVVLWIVIIVGFLLSIATIRVVRAAAIAASNNQYIDAARTLGATDARIVLRHIVPNVFPVVIVLATVNLGAAILAEATISFLGYGITTYPSWGSMLNFSGSSNFRVQPLLAVWPGVAIALAVYGFNMFGDALRDVLDPRLRGGR